MFESMVVLCACGVWIIDEHDEAGEKFSCSVFARKTVSSTPGIVVIFDKRYSEK